jgi:hypothetical protein
LSKLSPTDKIDAICKLAKYALPTMTSIESASAEESGLKDAVEVTQQIKKKNEMDSFLSPML